MGKALEAEAGPMALAVLAANAGDGRGQWVHLLTPGVIQARDGRTFLLDDPVAVVAASRQWAGATELAVDYEHQIDHAKVNGKPAPAAGWVKRLEARDDGVWGLVEWTEAAAGMIRRKEYRYVSPVIGLTADCRILNIRRVALTNSPALDLTALASVQAGMRSAPPGNVADGRFPAAGTSPGEPPEMPAHLLEARFKSDATAGDDGGHGAHARRAPEKPRHRHAPNRERSSLMSLSPRILAALDLSEGADEEDALAVIGDLRKRVAEASASPTSPAALSAMMSVMSTLAADRSAFRRSRIENKIEDALRTGVLVPAMREWATELCTSNEEAFDDFVKVVGAPFRHLMGPSPITPEMEAQLAARNDGGSAPQQSARGRIAAQLGIDPKALG